MKLTKKKGSLSLFFLFLLLAALVLTGCAGNTGADEGGVKKIGIIQIVEHPSLNTIREAIIAQLEQEGFIISTVGKGSFVAPKNLDLLRELNLKQLEELIQQALKLSSECNLTTDDLIEMVILFSNGGAEHNDND